ncbi:MAG TPA: nuclear transport factor 2 family protein, partial [Gemmatimonadaceae bacterium]|nr:nuclear transport factor 2 family protein [Gemmatimonadaceae bacterium]
FGNAPTITGRDAIREAIAGFFTAFVSLSHESKGAFLDGDTLILEAVVTYTRHDGQLVSVPAVTIFRIAGIAPNDGGRPVADQCRIYVDLTPLFAP